MVRERVHNGTILSEKCIESDPVNITSKLNSTIVSLGMNSTVLPLTTNNGTTNETTNGTRDVPPTLDKECIENIDFLSLPEVRTKNIGFVDTLFVWFRYIHFTIVPIIIFLIHKVIDKILKALSVENIIISN